MDLLNRSEAVLQELLVFVAQQVHKEVDQISVIDVSAGVVWLFFGI